MQGRESLPPTEATNIKLINNLKNRAKERQRTNYKITLNGENGYMALKDREMSATVAQIIIKHQSPEMKSAADYKAAVTARLFNMATGQRLKPLYAGDSAQVLRASASIGQLMGGLDNFSVNIVAKPSQPDPVFIIASIFWYVVNIRIHSLNYTRARLGVCSHPSISLIYCSEM